VSITSVAGLDVLLTESRWKGAVVQKIKRLEDTIAKIASKIDLSDLDLQTRPEDPETMSPSVAVMANSERPASPGPQLRDERKLTQTWEVIMDPRGGPASIPASCVSENIRTALPNSLPTSRRSDLISTGIITLRQALALFDTYHLRLDHFLYRILGDHISLDSARIASPLLTAAVCTVGALHSPSLGHLFEICYAEYKDLVTSQVFSKNLNADDIRGLCIGAFWLHELSWALIGNGMSVELSLGHENIN
jgi:hypothetical protein